VNRLDRLLQDWRIGKAVRWVPLGARVLDIGCHDGALFRRLGPALGEGIGLDPALVGPITGERYELRPGSFPADAPDESASFDAVTMLAVLEHVPPGEQPALAETVHRLLKPGGRFVLTVPSPRVDTILDALTRIHALDGMDADQHYGFEPDDVEPLMLGAGLTLVQHTTFQLRLNHLFVFERPSRTP
jgi:SAM-dependent methyltransferase